MKKQKTQKTLMKVIDLSVLWGIFFLNYEIKTTKDLKKTWTETTTSQHEDWFLNKPVFEGHWQIWLFPQCLPECW